MPSKKQTRRPDIRVLSWDMDTTIEEADRKMSREEKKDKRAMDLDF